MSGWLKQSDENAKPLCATGGIKETIQARHGTATFVPKGYTIKIINTYGRQVVSTWAFALHNPPTLQEWNEDHGPDKVEEDAKNPNPDTIKEDKQGKRHNSKEANGNQNVSNSSIDKALEHQPTTKESHGTAKGTEKTHQIDEKCGNDEDNKPKCKNLAEGWSSYLPNIRSNGKQAKRTGEKDEKSWASVTSYMPAIRRGRATSDEKDTERGSWSSYIPMGKGFSTYLKNNQAVSSFAAMHQRDSSKSLAEQLYAFSKTPVGAAGMSGYATSIYAAYNAYTSAATRAAASRPEMEYMSMPHSMSMTKHLTPKAGDTLVTNLRTPLLTIVEDKSPGDHDALCPSCDPTNYKQLGVEKWSEHGSCAENLVLALQELNTGIGLRGSKAIGRDITVNRIPTPLNLFLKRADNTKELEFESSACQRGDYVKFRAERDVIMVMSACPQDQLTEINDGRPKVAHFVVEGTEEAKKPAAEGEGEEQDQVMFEKEQSTTTTDGKGPASTLSNSASSAPRKPSRGHLSDGIKASPRKLERRTLSGQANSIHRPQKEEQSSESSLPKPEQPGKQSTDGTQCVRKKPRKIERRTML